MEGKRDIRFSYSAIAEPISALFWNNRQFLQWGREAGYNSAEFFPFARAAVEIVTLNIEAISDFSEIRSGHVRYNPYATFWKVITRQEDPLRPGTPLGLYNLAFANQETSLAALQRLEEVLVNFQVITYPHEVCGQNPYGQFANPLLQTHPAVFSDTSNAEALIKQVREGKYRGIVWDTFHALEEATPGHTPLKPWQPTLEKLLAAGVVSEIHAQVGRVKEKYTEVGDQDWLTGMTGENPNYNSELAQMLKIVKAYDPGIPLTIEIGLEGLVKAGVIKKSRFMHDAIPQAQEIHKQLIDYVKRA